MTDFKKGDRVQSHPATDLWVRGDRYGTVTKVTKRFVYVLMDVSQRLIRFHPENILRKE